MPVIFLFIIDRIIKHILMNIARPAFAGAGGVHLIGDFFQYKFTLNRGIAFGLGDGINNLIFLYTCIFIFLILCFFLVKFFIAKKYFFAFSLSLIAFGAFSNILDRIYSGGVIDYLDLKHFTVFNLADVMITAGTFLIAVKILRIKGISR